MARDLVCPYCFETFQPHQLVFRCIKPAGCDPEEDKAFSEYLRLPSPKLEPKIVVPPNRGSGMPHEAVCSCGGKTTKAVCPKCHNELPSQYAQSSNRMIALIGAKEAGKSHYVAVLIHELMNSVGERFDAAFQALDERTRTRYREDFERYLYADRVVIPATRSARASMDVRYPLVYRLSLEKRFLWFRWPAPTTVAFFDTAGEDLGSDDIMATETRYIANSDGLIFLLDPFQIPAVRQKLGLPDSGIIDGANPADIVVRAAELIRKIRGLPPGKKIKTPVALAFSKIDAIRSLLDPDSAVNRASNHDGYFDRTDGQLVNDTVRSHIKSWMGSHFTSVVSHNFANHAYFGISALGSPPEHGEIAKGVQAFRIEDPFLWMLYKMKLIKGRRGAK